MTRIPAEVTLVDRQRGQYCVNVRMRLCKSGVDLLTNLSALIVGTRTWKTRALAKSVNLATEDFSRQKRLRRTEDKKQKGSSIGSYYSA